MLQNYLLYMAEDQILDEKRQREFETVSEICKADAEQNVLLHLL